MATSTITPVKPSPVRDTYKFGNGLEPVLQPGTMGWSAADLENPEIERQWLAGRYEILEGVLTIMPASLFRGGSCALRLVTLLRNHLDQEKIDLEVASEADIQINNVRRVRSDYACVFGEDLAKFAALKFEQEDTDWRDYALSIPPSLVIESVSRGHETHDRQTKLMWYSEFGVPRYWIVDAYAKSLECLMLRQGIYEVDAMGTASQAISPASVAGLTISLPDVWGRK
jgi:Uma2 family endonuclease